MQAELFNIESSKEFLLRKIAKSQRVIEKITKMDPLLHFQSVQKLNRVAFLPVQIKHTSQFIIDLGCEFFVEVKGGHAIEILRRRIESYESEMIKIEGEKGKVQEELKSQKAQTKTVGNATVTVIGEEDGENIVNIVEVDDNQSFELTTSQENKQSPEQKQLSSEGSEDPVSNETDLLEDFNEKQYYKLKEKIEKQQVENIQKQKQQQDEIPKRISKFKAQRMRQRE